MAIVKALFVCRLYHERLSQVNNKLAEVEAGRAAEYLEPLAVLLENMQVRTKVAGNFSTQAARKGYFARCPHLLTISPVFRYLQRALSRISQAQV